MSEDKNAPGVSLRSARESIRWLIKSGGLYLDADGLKIPRDPRRSPSQLDVDEILERLEVLGVPESEISIAIKARNSRSWPGPTSGTLREPLEVQIGGLTPVILRCRSRLISPAPC